MRAGLLCAASLLTLIASPALAQSGQTGTEAEATDSAIVVTARRTEENQQDVPIAITAFSEDSLKERSIQNQYDLAKSVPGLVTNADSGNSALPQFSIRGRGQVFGAASGSVETYFADVPLSPPFQIPTLPPQFFDLQSVQVLKGPQGTLFGRNTTGGAVLFVPAAPSDKLEGYVLGQLGDYNARNFEAAVNIPLGDMGGLRLAGQVLHRDGYAHTVAGRQDAAASYNAGATFNLATGQFVGAGAVTLPSIDIYNQDVVELRGTLRLKLSDTIENSTIVTYHGDKNRGTIQLRALRPGTQLAGGIGFYYPNLLPNNPRIADVGTDLSRPRSQTYAIINTTLWDVSPSLRIKNIASFISSKGWGNNPSDVDGSPFPAIDLVRPVRQLRNRQYYEELQLQGKAGPVDFIVGGTIDLTRQPGAPGEMNIVTNTFDPGGFDAQFRQSRYTSKAIFGSLTYHATDALTLTAAGRYTWDDITDISIQYNNSPKYPVTAPTGPADPLCTAQATSICIFLPGHQKFSGATYNFGVDYKVSDDVMVYGGYRHGYKRGGFNGRGGSVASFAPEKVDNFFVGLKTEFDLPGGRSHFNIEGFWDEYKGAQRSFLDLAGGALVTTIQNVPKLRYRGFDADAVLNLTDWFRLSANYTFVDAKYINYPDNTVASAIGVLTFNGAPAPFISAFSASHPLVNNRLAANVPGLNSRNKVNLQGRFHTELSNGIELALIPSLTYQSKFYINDNSFVIPAIGEVLFNGGVGVCAACDGANTAPGYTTGDLRFEVKNIANRVDLSLNVTNIANKTYIQGGAGIWQFGVDTVSYAPPRMFYGEVIFHF